MKKMNRMGYKFKKVIRGNKENENSKFPEHNLNYYTEETGKLDDPDNFTCWTLDSGASCHMTNNLKGLKDIVKHKESIVFANGETTKSTFKGTYEGYINDNKIILHNVLYIPAFRRSLLSIDCLSERHFKTIFYNKNNNNLASIYNKRGNKLCTIKSTKNRIYKLWTSTKKISFNEKNIKICNSITQLDDNMELWHRRLGHFNIDMIKDKLKNIKIDEKCEVCLRSKFRNKPYKSSINRANEPFELIHMDTIIVPNSSIYGNKFIFTILDDYSRYGWVFCLKSKSEIFNTFTIWYNKVKNIHNKNIKYIRSDNGTEFKNNNFSNFCNKEGIIQQFTVPYNLQQNGRSERFNGTLIFAATAMLRDAKLHHKFWEDAVYTANYIHNRIPHKGINNQVPFEILYNNKVD